MALQKLSRLTVGTGGVGTIGDAEQLRVIRRVMDQGDVWMHCANYGEGAFRNLKVAFAERPSQVPPTIFKVDGITAEGFRSALHGFLSETGLERMDIGQVCGFPLSEEPDDVLAAMAAAREQGKVDTFIMEVLPHHCPGVPALVEAGLFEGYVFYYNVVECNATQDVASLLERRGVPILAMRIFAGGEVFGEGTPQHERLERLRRLCECASIAELCVRFALSLPGVVTGIAGTSKVANLEYLLGAVRDFQPLDAEVIDTIRSTLRRQ